jgi:hypothetical protein
MAWRSSFSAAPAPELVTPPVVAMVVGGSQCETVDSVGMLVALL